LGRVRLRVGDGRAEVACRDDFVWLRHGGSGEAGLRCLQRFLDEVGVEIELGGIGGRIGLGQLGNGIFVLGLEGVGIDFNALDRERAGGRAVAGRNFHAGDFVQDERAGDAYMDEEGDAQGAEDPPRLQALGFGMDSQG
jgi:hypothetical protein